MSTSVWYVRRENPLRKTHDSTSTWCSRSRIEVSKHWFWKWSLQSKESVAGHEGREESQSSRREPLTAEDMNKNLEDLRAVGKIGASGSRLQEAHPENVMWVRVTKLHLSAKASGTKNRTPVWMFVEWARVKENWLGLCAKGNIVPCARESSNRFTNVNEWRKSRQICKNISTLLRTWSRMKRGDSVIRRYLTRSRMKMYPESVVSRW